MNSLGNKGPKAKGAICKIVILQDNVYKTMYTICKNHVSEKAVYKLPKIQFTVQWKIKWLVKLAKYSKICCSRWQVIALYHVCHNQWFNISKFLQRWRNKYKVT